MKLHILSDLHTEFQEFSPPETDADVVVLAGDIGVGLDGIAWVAREFPELPVVYVPGNHEFYGYDIGFVDRLRRPQTQISTSRPPNADSGRKILLNYMKRAGSGSRTSWREISMARRSS